MKQMMEKEENKSTWAVLSEPSAARDVSQRDNFTPGARGRAECFQPPSNTCAIKAHSAGSYSQLQHRPLSQLYSVDLQNK